MNKRTLAVLSFLTIAFIMSVTILSQRGETRTYAVSSGQTYTVETEKTASPQRTTSAGTPINDVFDWSSVEMEETPESTCFSWIGYDSRHETLVVTFRDSGANYAYYGVPQYVWDDLYNAKSKGGFYNSDIKGQYDCEKLE